MSNETAERLLFGPYIQFVADKWEDDERSGLFSMGAYISITLPTVIEAERAAERRATVERIRERLVPGGPGDWGKSDVNPFDLVAMLDEEAAR